MKIRKRSVVFIFSRSYWIIPVVGGGLLACLAWILWWGVPTYRKTSEGLPKSMDPITLTVSPGRDNYLVERDVTAGQYLAYIEDLARRYDRERFYPIDEYVLVRSNPWLIDSLASTDYYLRKERREFVYDPDAVVVLHRGELLRIPDSATVCAIQDEIGYTLLDLNIPSYRLRVKIYDEVVCEIPVRVGRNQRKYLSMAGTVVDLRTRPGSGRIIRINRDPDFINPANNRPYDRTRRDDGRYTLLPGIPWLEPEIDGLRLGQMIHPTTNIETLNKAYSNGCIGTSEADAWRLYYYAPLGTKIIIRYDLEEDHFGIRVFYRDIYGWRDEV